MIGLAIETKKFKVRRGGKDEIVVWDSVADANTINSLSAWYSEASGARIYAADNAIRYRVQRDHQKAAQKRYMLGVVLAPIDDVVRAQVGLDADQGLVLTQVSADGPAEKAGCEKNDLILELDSQKVTSEESLRELIQKIGDREVPLKLIRKGKLVESKIKPYLSETAPSDRPLALYMDPNTDYANAYTWLSRATNPDAQIRFVPSIVQDASAAKDVKGTKEETLQEIRELLKKLESKLDEMSK
jgi:predicted metalloprotease with PDZ domain